MAREARFTIDGMDCAACAVKIDTAVRRLPGVEDVRVSVTAASMTVMRGAALDEDHDIEAKVRSLGYGIAPQGSAAAGRDHGHDHHDHDHDHDHHDHDDHGSPHSHADDDEVAGGPWWASRKARLTIASGAALAVAWLLGRLAPGTVPFAYEAAMLVGLLPIAWRAVMAARNGMPFTIESLMTIAAVGAVFIGAGEEAAMVVFLFLVGELLEGMAAAKARKSIEGLAALMPRTAFVERGGRTEEVQASALAVGDTILVRPGDRVPADGKILSGESAVDEAPVTGESVPVAKRPGDGVYAGTVNGAAALRVSVSAAATDNTIARIVKLVREAQEAKAPMERFIDRFARYYTPGVLAVGALVALVPPLLFGASLDEWLYKGLAILLIGCPCALVISTPAAIASALSSGARRGLLMKGGAVLETLGKVDIVALDKTGTLTAGRPQVTDIVEIAPGAGEVLPLSAALETGSSHPLAKAVLDRAEADGVTVRQASDVAALAGAGISGRVAGSELFLGSAEAAAERAALPQSLSDELHRLSGEGKTVAVLLRDGAPVGAIAMRDEPRPDAKAGLAALAAERIDAIMLTGDNRRAGEAVGRELGIKVEAGLLPADKQRIVRALQAEGKIVAKVGDGINDAPALAAADVGIAMGGGTDVALETADAAILNGRITDLAAMVSLSRRAVGNIHQNITIALGLKGVFLVTTLVGITGLWPAILADTGATVLVTANAMRLLRSQ